MAYSPTVWTDRAVSTPNLYNKTGETSTQVTLIAAPGTVTQAGTPINATNMNKLEAGVAASVPKGTSNTEIVDLFSMINEVDTRSTFVTWTNGLITMVEEKNGTTVLRTTTVTRTNGVISSIDVDVSGNIMRYTVNRNASGKITSVTKAVI